MAVKKFLNFTSIITALHIGILLFFAVLFPIDKAFAVTTTIATSSTTAATQPSTMRHIVRTSEGTLHAFIQMGTNTTKCSSGGLWWLYSTDSGSNWTCGSQLSSDTTNLMYADARADSSDNIYIVYSAAGTGGSTSFDVVYRKLTSSNCAPAPCDWTVESAQTVLDGDNSGDNAGFSYATIELEGTTRAWIAVREYDGTNYQVGMYHSDTLGAAPTWTVSQATLDTAGTNASYHYPTLVRFGSKIGVIYNVESGSDLDFRYRADADGLTAWNTETIISSTYLIRFPSFSAVGDTSGNIYLAAEGSDVWFSQYLSNWSTIAVVATANISDQFVSVGTDGSSAWVLYGDTTGMAGTSKKLMYKKGVSPFATANFDTNGTNVVSYHDVFDKAWVYDASANTYEDETTDVGDSGTADVAHSDSSSMVKDVGDIVYFGKSTTYDAATWTLSTNGTGAGTIVWEYCSAIDGSSACTTWSSLTFTSSQQTSFKGGGNGGFTVPSDWVASKVNAESTAYFYLRARTSVAFTIGPVGSQVIDIPLISWAGLANTTAGLFGAWTENSTSVTKARYATILSFNANPSAPTSLGGHVAGSYTSDTTPTLTFSLSDTDSSDTVKYQIQIDDSSDFSSAVVDYTSALAAQGATSFTVGQSAGSGSYTTGSSGQTLSDGSFYWRVKAIDDDAAASSYSTANSGAVAFIVDATSPSTPGTPSTSSTSDTTPTWSWTASSDSGSGLATTAYTLQWSQSSNFSSGVSSSTSTTNTFTHSSALTDGTWYFRAKASDTAGNESSYSSAGSTVVDSTMPASVDLDSPGDSSYTNSDRPSFKWKATTDSTSGLSKYTLLVDNPSLGSSQPNGDFTIDNITPSRTTDVETNKYTIHYENFSDADDTNNYISVTTKSHADWATSENDGKVREGKVVWKVKALDNSSNETSSSRTLFVDRSGPSVELTQVNDVQYGSTNLATTDKTPTIFGKITDSLSGGDTSLSQDESGPKVASAPKYVEIQIEKKSGLIYELLSLYTLNLNNIQYTCDGSQVTDSSKQKCDKYASFSYTPTLEYGTYRITLSGKDNAGNSSSGQSLILDINSLAQITTTAEKKVIKTATQTLTPTKQKQVIEELEYTKPAEPSGLEKVTQEISVVKNTADSAKEIVVNFVNDVGQGIQNVLTVSGRATKSTLDTTGASLVALGGKTGKAITSVGHDTQTLLTSIGKRYAVFVATTPKAARAILSGIGNSVSFSRSLIGSMSTAASKIAAKNIQNTQDAFAKGAQTITVVTTVFSKNIVSPIAKLAKSTIDTTKEKASTVAFGVGERVQNISDGAGLAIIKFTYNFVSTPTKISDVKSIPLSKTSVKITWTTNHPATGKVNWGYEEGVYVLETQADKRTTQHEFVLTNLTPGTEYHYEVMSQNKNYVYDANRIFKTLTQ